MSLTYPASAIFLPSVIQVLQSHFVYFCSVQPATPTRTTATTPIQSLPHSQTPPKRLDTPTLEEPSDLEELEQFAKTFKQRRIKLGFTQVRLRLNNSVSLRCSES